MANKKPRKDSGAAPGLGELIAELVASPAPEKSSIPRRARRAGPYLVPASIAPAVQPGRIVLANRFKQHLRGVAGASKPVDDPDEYVPPSRPSTPRPSRPPFQRPVGLPTRRFGPRNGDE
jgi:hypothetical protein